MITYADSSVLIAWFHPDDEFAGPVTPWVREHVTDFIWNPILRAEVRHNLRKMRSPYARTAWNAYRAAESNHRLTFGRERLADLLAQTDELSAEQAALVPASTWDFFHVAAALHARVACFATCDKLQAELATESGLPKVKLFKA